MAPDELLFVRHGTAAVGRAPAELGRPTGVWLCRAVGAVSHFLCMQDASENACRFRSERPPLLLELDQRGRRADSGRSVEQLAVVAEQRAEFSLADMNSVLQHGLKHRLKLTGRARNDLQHLGRRGLLL